MTGLQQDLWSLALLAVFLVGVKVGVGLAALRARDADRKLVDDLAAKRTPQGPYWQRERR